MNEKKFLPAAFEINNKIFIDTVISSKFNEPLRGQIAPI